MTEFSEYTYSADDLDGAKSCSCSHCTSEGRYDQDANCIWYRRPKTDDNFEPMTLNRAARIVPATRGRRRAL